MQYNYINGQPWRQQYNFNTTQTTDITGWSTGTSLPGTLGYSQVVVTKSRVYLLGGSVAGTPVSTVYTAPINSDGTLGTWATGTSLPIALNYSQVIVTKNRIYLLGGVSAGVILATVYTAPINENGTLGAWAMGTSLPAALGESQVVATKNRVYLLGGINISGSEVSTVYTAPINSDGTLGIWATGTSLPSNLSRSSAITTKNRVYLLGGATASTTYTSNVYTAPINTDGTLGTWSTIVSALPGVSCVSNAIITNSKVYLFIGYNGTASDIGIYTAPINTDGTIGTWVTGTSLLTAVRASCVICTSSKVYVLGGNTTSEVNTIWSANFSGGLNDYSDKLLTAIWDEAKKLTIKIPPQSENLTNFPMLVNLTSSCGLTGQDCTKIFKEISPVSTNDPYASNVVLAMPMEGTNGSTTFKDYCGKTVTAGGSAQISTVKFKYGSSSAYFDGSGDYLTIANSTDFNFGSSDFTIEFWLYQLSRTAGEYDTLFSIGTNGYSSSMYLTMGGYVGGGSAFLIANNAKNGWAVNITLDAYVPSLNAWHHIVVCRFGSIFKIYIDGIQVGTATYSGSINNIVGAVFIGFDGTSSTTYTDGYIDDFRITKGVARYTSSFTPPLASLITVVSNPPTFTNDPNWSSVVLAMPMSGSNGSTTFIDLKGHTIGGVTGNSQISSTQYKFGGSSAYFDGNGDYVYLSNTTDFQFDLGDFTIEFYTYMNSVAGTIVPFLQSDPVNTSTADKWFIGCNSVSIFMTAHAGGGNCSTSWTPIINTWYHIAVTRSSGTTYIFVDGVCLITSATFSAKSWGQYGISIGGITTPYWLNGYIDDLQIIKGLAKYTTNFTPPTSSVIKPPNIVLPFSDDPYWDNVVLAMPMTGTNNSTSFFDLKGKSISISGNTKLVTSQYKFGGSSAYFDGSDDYLSIPNSTNWQFGTGDFTIEFWAYYTSIIAGNNIILGYCDSWNTLDSWYVDWGNGNFVRGTGGSNVVIIPISRTTNTWQHIVVSRENGLIRTFTNGIKMYEVSYAGIIGAPQSSSLLIGKPSWMPAIFNGYINDLRITKGIARYTANFTPPNLSFHHSGIVTTPKKFYIETYSTSTPCFVEIERWDALKRSAQLWVNVPTISTSSNTLLTMLYNSSADDNTSNQDFWDGVGLALPMNGTHGSTSFIDLKNNSISVVGNAIISTTQYKFNGSSAYFDGGGDRISATYSLSGSSDFTIEMYVYLINGGHGAIYSRILHIGSGNTTGAFNIVCDYNQNPAPVFASIWTPGEVWLGGTPALANNRWYHIAVCRKNNIWYMFYDGIKCSGDISNSMDLSQTNWNFGSNASNAESFYGYIDEIRVTKGFARYTSDFTPPTKSYLANALGYIGDIGSYPAQQVWDGNYAAVYHLSQDPSTTVKDSTLNTRNATSVGTMLSSNIVSSLVGNATQFDGIDDGLNCNFATNIDTFTVESVFYTPDIASGRNGHLVTKSSYYATTTNDFPFSLLVGATENISVSIDATGSDWSADVSLTSPNSYQGSFTYAAITNTPTIESRLYVNGSSVASGAGINPIDNARNWFIGKASYDNGAGATTNQFNGIISTVRISQTARTAGWLNTSYKADFDQLAIFEFFSFILNNPYPTSYIKTYGLQQQLQLTATFSGIQSALYYDTTFYTTSGIALTTVTGTLNSSTVTALLPTNSGIDYFWYAIISVPSIFFNYTTPTYSFYNRYLCSGICNYINAPASGIVVNLHRRQTGQLIATTTTAGTGTFILDSIYSDMHYIVALHPDDSKNALIYDKIIPIY